MPKHKGGKVAAVIDIGSSDVKMQISQVKNKEIIPLDTLEYPLKLGHEVFNYGKISFECLRELSHILTGYSNVMKEYGVDQYKVVGTTALREAQNKEFIQEEQLRIAEELLEKVAIIGRTHGISYEQMANILKLFFEE